MRDKLIEFIKNAHSEWLKKEYDHETDKSVCEYVADRLLAEGVIVLLGVDALGHNDPAGEPGKCGLFEQCRANTVRKMQKRLKADAVTIQDHTGKLGVVVGVGNIDDVAKEMLEGNNDT